MEIYGSYSQKDTSDKIKKYLKNNAVVLDVRTQQEWDEGHVENSKHIVLNLLPTEIEQIKSWNKPIIAVCKSGGRSEKATQFLSDQGLDVINGGPWQNVDQYMN